VRYALIACISFFFGCNSKSKQALQVAIVDYHSGDFGTCCKDLKDAMEQPPSSSFRIDDGVLFMTVGFMETDQGVGNFDHAVVFRPFCGKQLQSRQDIAAEASGPSHLISHVGIWHSLQLPIAVLLRSLPSIQV
jgi:hypothetical protein